MAQKKLVTLLLVSTFVLVFFDNSNGAVTGRRESDNKEFAVSKDDEEAAAVALTFLLFLGILMGATAPNKETLVEPVTTPQMTSPESIIFATLGNETKFDEKLSRIEAEQDTDAGSDSNVNVNEGPLTDISIASGSKLKTVFYEEKQSGEVTEVETDLEIDPLAPSNNVVVVMTDTAEDFSNSLEDLW